MLSLFHRPNLQGKKKNIRNLVPMYSFDIAKMRHLFAMQDRDRIDVIFSRAYREFSKDFIITEQITYDLVYKSIHSRIDKMLPDKIGMIMLHIHNKALNFLPIDYPKHLIAHLANKYQWKLGYEDGFEDLLNIESIYTPLNYFLVLKLGYLLGLNRNNLNRLFSDSLQPSILERFGAIQPNIPFEMMQFPEQSHNITIGFANLTKFAKTHSEVVVQKGFFEKQKSGRIICHTDFLNAIQSEDQRIQYRKMVGFSPYMNARFWYALAKLLGMYDPIQVRKQINALNNNNVYDYRKLADYYYYLELKK